LALSRGVHQAATTLGILLPIGNTPTHRICCVYVWSSRVNGRSLHRKHVTSPWDLKDLLFGGRCRRINVPRTPDRERMSFMKTTTEALDGVVFHTLPQQVSSDSKRLCNCKSLKYRSCPQWHSAYPKLSLYNYSHIFRHLTLTI
jgi:hypothetical protein